jgi:hypothetical protein
MFNKVVFRGDYSCTKIPYKYFFFLKRNLQFLKKYYNRLAPGESKAESRAFILAQLENPTIPPDDPRWNDLSSSEPGPSGLRLVGAADVVIVSKRYLYM